MNINWSFIVEAIKALAWPVVGAFALYLLRRPLIELVGQLARRATKISVFNVSLDLATLPELKPSWSVGDTDVRRLSSSDIFYTGSEALFKELLKPVRADYAIVDLRSGKAWLTSRLFIFSVILGEAAGLRAFVFLETAGSTRRRFLGVATPSNVRRALGRRYPWFEEAFTRALSSSYTNVKPVDAQGVSAFSNQTSAFDQNDPSRVSNLVRQFVSSLQRTTDPPETERSSYLDIGATPKTWERGRWLDGARLERDLVGALDYAWVNESLDSPRRLVSEAVVRRSAPFVALVDGDRRFVGLVDRYALLSQMSLAGNTAGDDQNAS